MASQTLPTNQYQQNNDSLVSAINIQWLSTCAYSIFLMRTGFAFREAGSSRLKSMQSILFKNVLDIGFATAMWWFTGYAFAFGFDKGRFLGNTNFATESFDRTFTAFNYINWFYQWTLSMVASAIVLGPVSERITLWGIILYNMFFIGWIYPIVVHWCYAGGWLQDLGYYDQSGGGVVLMTAGFAGLFASMIVGPRIDRYSPAHVADFRPNNVPFAVLGSFLIYFGFYSFNTVSTYGIVGFESTRVPMAQLNTVLASTAALVTSSMTHYIFNKNTTYRYSNQYLLGGALAGCAAVSTASSGIAPWAAFIYGFVVGPIYVGLAKLLNKVHIDDPVDSVAIFAGGGAIGLLLTSFFETTYGVFYGGVNVLGINILAIVTIFAWVAVNTFVFLFLLKCLKILRIDPQVELMGQDQAYYGGLPYSYDVTTYSAAQVVKVSQDQGVMYRPDAMEMSKQNGRGTQPNHNYVNDRINDEQQNPLSNRGNNQNIHHQQGITY